MLRILSILVAALVFFRLLNLLGLCVSFSCGLHLPSFLCVIFAAAVSCLRNLDLLLNFVLLNFCCRFILLPLLCRVCLILVACLVCFGFIHLLRSRCAFFSLGLYLLSFLCITFAARSCLCIPSILLLTFGLLIILAGSFYFGFLNIPRSLSGVSSLGLCLLNLLWFINFFFRCCLL